MYHSSAHFTRLSVVLLMALGALSLPTLAQAAPSPCPQIEFLGLHGVNEGSAGRTANADHWGKTIEDLYQKFRAGNPTQGGSLHADAVSYGRVEIDPNIPWNIGAVGIGARYAASALQGDLVDLSQTCPSTFTVIAGYSQGAWAVDKALRNMKNSANPSIRFSLANIAGVFLMGDPAWPRQGDRSGIATFFDQGYDTETDYLDNGLSTARFRSICLAYSGGQQDPICHYSPNADWKGEIPVHQQYAEGGVTQTGADWLAGLARSVGGAR